MSTQQAEHQPRLVAVAGGTGTLGGHLVGRVTEHGVKVRILARDAERAKSLENEMVEVAPGDVRDQSALEAAVAGCDAVVSAVSAFGRPRGGDLRSADSQGNINPTGLEGRSDGSASADPARSWARMDPHMDHEVRLGQSQETGVYRVRRGWPNGHT